MKILIVLFVIYILLAPVASHAQYTHAQRIQTNTDLLPSIPYTIPHYPTEHLFAIGVGGLIGVVLVPLFVEGIGYAIGGLLIGGILGNYWYEAGFWPLGY